MLDNAKAMEKAFAAKGVSMVTGGTSNHMLVVDTEKSFGINGKIAEELLDEVEINVNKQIIPDDPNPPLRPSGNRLGTPAATTRGMKEAEMEKLAGWMIKVLKSPDDAALRTGIKAEVEKFCQRYPVPGIA